MGPLTRDNNTSEDILAELVSGSVSGDLVFITQDGKCAADKCFVFHHLPELKTFSCEKCEHSHDSTTILVQHMKTKHLREALYQLYIVGDSQLLAEALNIPSTHNERIFDQTTVQIVDNITFLAQPSFESTRMDIPDDFQSRPSNQKRKKKQKKQKNINLELLQDRYNCRKNIKNLKDILNEDTETPASMMSNEMKDIIISNDEIIIIESDDKKTLYINYKYKFIRDEEDIFEDDVVFLCSNNVPTNCKAIAKFIQTEEADMKYVFLLKEITNVHNHAGNTSEVLLEIGRSDLQKRVQSQNVDKSTSLRVIYDDFLDSFPHIFPEELPVNCFESLFPRSETLDLMQTWRTDSR